jgi:uncharacterized membrane protein (UPF0127 family)
MKKIVVLALGIVLIGAACNKQEPVVIPQLYVDGHINIAGKSVSFQLADEPAEQEKGLSGRESLEENQAMLFVFSFPTLPTFWMRDMNFPIDMVWVNGDEVIDISADVPPEPGVPLEQLKTYAPKKPADKVIELKAGWAARNGLKIGDKIEVVQVVH